jgi:hypothetical protein
LKQKVFCVGLCKTGTTSLGKALVDLGLKMGDQTAGESLVELWAERDFAPIIRHCYSADAFQDVPFSLPFTFQELHRHFPNAKFVLSLRDNPEQWYSSLTRFHSKLFADGMRVPTCGDLKRAFYHSPGYVYRTHKLIHDTPDSSPYERESLLAFYRRHEEGVREYFRHLPGKLLEINVSKARDYRRLCMFLGRMPQSDDFPWMNKADAVRRPARERKESVSMSSV